MNNPNPAPEEAQQDDVPTEFDDHGETPHDDDSLFDDGTGYVP